MTSDPNPDSDPLRSIPTLTSMMASRVISLAVFPWTVRAPEAQSIPLFPGWDAASPRMAAPQSPTEYRVALARGVAARVPGCVHHALIAAGLIGSPDHADNEEHLRWIGSTVWEYRCEFDWSGAPAADCERLELVVDGLDTVATLALNDVPIGDAASFHFPHRFDIARALRPGRNSLVVRLAPPLARIRAEEARLGTRPFNGDEGVAGGTGTWDPFIFIRKPACNLGWDWGPRVATVGIAGGAWIERWSGARIAHIRPLIEHASTERAQVRIHVDAAVDPINDAPLTAQITMHDPHGRGIVCRGECELGRPDQAGGALGSAVLAFDNPSLWWPRGYGPQQSEAEQPRYGIRVQLRAGDEPVDLWQGRIGLRTVRLDTAPDKWGSAFTLRINGQAIFCQGANWIPEGLFAGYAEEAVIRHRVRDAAEMNANMLRVWGGGLYEPECFYEECDRRGILVWQDFMFACGMYPEEAPFGGDTGLIAREARYQLSRLSSHPSVALWCGGNETIWGHDKWGWKERLKPGQSWGRGFWLDLLPRLCAEVDPTRPYWPNSPWSGVDENGVQRDVLDPDHGNRHTWEVDAWKNGFRAPLASGGGGVPRFCSEFGHQSPSCIETLSEQLRAGERHADFSIAKVLAMRQRGPGGDARWYDAPLAAELGAEAASRLIAAARESEAGFAAWLSSVHELQARAVARGIEWHRVHRPRCGGVLFWQLNDCWAGHSWSAIDAAGRRKPLWHAAQRAMSPRLLSIHIIDGSPKLFAVNDTDDPWEGELTVYRSRRPNEQATADWRTHVRLGPRTAGAIGDLSERLALATDQSWQILHAELAGTAATFYRK